MPRSKNLEQSHETLSKSEVEESLRPYDFCNLI